MPNFAYKARDIKGTLIEGVIDAKDEETLATVLKDRDIYLTQTKEIKERKERTIKKTAFILGSITRRDVIVFTTHLASVLSAGIPIIQGLQDLEEQTENKKFRQIISKIKEDVYGGSDLSATLSQFPKAFSKEYVNMVKAAEASGNMDTILYELAGFLEWQEDINRDIKKASMYPLMLMVAISALVTAIFVFAFPRITKILLDMNVPLPLITRIMIGLSEFLKQSWWMIFSGIIVTIVGFKVAGKSRKGRLWIDSFKLRIPVVGELIRKIALSRFSNHLALMWSAGINFSDSLTLTAGVVGNAAISRVIISARDDVMAGGILSESLKKSKIFPPLVIRMISIGESTGNMDKSLNNVSRYYNREIPATIKKLFAVMEPLIFVFLAFVVMCIALSIYLPLYSTLSQIGK